MFRLVLFLLGVLAAAIGLSWLAENPGTITVDWLGYRAEPTVFQAVVGLILLILTAMFVWTLLRQIWQSPAAAGRFLARRRQKRGLDALSSGMIAIGAGDRASATRYAVQARKALPNEPLTQLLRAQAAQLTGDRATARRIFEAMLASPDTEQLGLRGLYLEAGREGEAEAQRQFAERAIKLNPKLAWPAEALFDLQCKEARWAEALVTLATAKRHGHIDKTVADRRRAVLLTAQAQALEDKSADKALALALEAHGLASDLIPAAAIAARLYAARGNTGKVAKIVQKTWVKAAHPDLATAYAFARIGDSPRDRLDRVKQLAALNLHSPESAIAVAAAALEARQPDVARHALLPLLDGRVTRRVALLMARIESEDSGGDKGRAREWLARAVHAERDPVWTADGVVLEQWAPVSPVTGALDAVTWRVPVAEAVRADSDEIAAEHESLAAILLAGEPVIDATPVTVAVVSEEADEISPAPPAEVAVKPPVVVEAAPVTVTATKIASLSESPGKTRPVETKKPETPPAKTGRPVQKARPEPKIFVAPPAPDDPGAVSDEGDALPKKPYRMTP